MSEEEEKEAQIQDIAKIVPLGSVPETGNGKARKKGQKLKRRSSKIARVSLLGAMSTYTAPLQNNLKKIS